ncbi:hypothetical protein WT92_21570 [Burkholderia stagnalis]|nr:hypothetical protein WT09_03875 [Burkholderia stagnalis]KWN93062.1 hypothetical protein WT92_21570 [Burkholderia stagnalis]KWO43264.1 hypothetical protein WT95_30985 [Burkholderia stagnalis]
MVVEQIQQLAKQLARCGIGSHGDMQPLQTGQRRLLLQCTNQLALSVAAHAIKCQRRFFLQFAGE